jgi:hypothetical protein
MAGKEQKTNLPRVLSLFVAFLGCVITSVPFFFGVGGDPVDRKSVV